MKVSERIRQSLENDIRNGALLPGDAIDEQELATRYQVSRTPVREALLQLKVQGMLESQPRNGMVVARLDVQELLAIWELVAEMEGVCTRMACQRMTPEERQELARLHRAAAPIAEADDGQAWREANHDFHEVLYRGCRNPYLREQLLALRARTGAYLRHAFTAVGRVRASYEQHGELVEAILANDPERAHRMMMRHISLAQGAKGLADFLINLPRSMVKT
ncbi:GntR family transcriptional regulator [Bordetella hinzii]|uniref:GntR family transcriptional regulator n=1 Tax=Bordetella hinzii TaxID=103855 RepID=UPI001C02AF73|nr:GntR family transcriptional regulator [Bordetella hinzii]QWF52040.1 GntR family transcriptional regulator [Bordetella hinzii]